MTRTYCKSKKGFSLMIAIVIAFVLTTLGFAIASLAIMQANSTGTDQNDRQVYLNAKSALEFANQAIKDGALTPPSGDSYYNIALTEGVFSAYSSDVFTLAANEAAAKLNAKNNNTVYLKISNTGGKVNIKAEGYYGKYTLEDQSIDNLSLGYSGSHPDPVKPGDHFLMVGQQSMFTAFYDDNQTRSFLQEYQNDGSYTLEGISREVWQNNFKLANFPIVTTYLAYNDASNGRSNMYSHQGVYLLGNSGTSKLDGKLKTAHASFFCNNAVYTEDIKAPLVVISHDIYAIQDGGNRSNLYISGLTDSGNLGVLSNTETILYFPHQVTVYYADQSDSNTIKKIKTYSEGYYKFKGDLFSSTANPTAITSADAATALGGVTNFVTAYESETGNDIDSWVSRVHSGQEEGTNIPNQTAWLGKDASWKSTGTVTTTSSSLSTNANFIVYMGPRNTGLASEKYYYDAGEIDFLWNNKAALSVKNNAELHFIADSLVLTFGSTEKSYTCPVDTGNSGYSISSTDIYGSNVLSKDSTGGKFVLHPYVDTSTHDYKSSFTVTFVTKVEVKLSSTESYYIDPGKYTFDFNNSDFKSKFPTLTAAGGIDLFSDEAKEIFTGGVIYK